MVIKANKGMLFVDLTKTYVIRTYTTYENYKKIEFEVWDNNKNEYNTWTLTAKNKTNLEKAINGLFVAIQRGAKTVDLDKYVEE